MTKGESERGCVQQLGSPAILRSSFQLDCVIIRMSASPVPNAARMHSPRPRAPEGRVAGLHLTDGKGKGKAVTTHYVAIHCLYQCMFDASKNDHLELGKKGGVT